MLPIRRVVLFKHGVGHFERRGDVQGDAEIELGFRASEMNDVLKSLTVLDLGGGVIRSISYDSTKSLAKQLEEVGIELGDDEGLTGLLAQVRGAEVEAKVGTDLLRGVVLGVESFRRELERGTLESFRISLLVDGGSVRSFDVLDVEHLELLDETLRRNLQHLLAALITAKKKDRKRLTIFASGEGSRPVAATYTVEMPVWKTSYRLLLPEGDEAPVLQGWALVDNPHDEDWEDVALTLVAGLPVSFVHDLYAPRYKRRPVVEVQEEEAYAPPQLERGMRTLASETVALADEAPMPPPAAPMPAAAPARAMKRHRAPPGGAPVSREDMLRAGPAPQTRTAEAGDLFQYEVENPVTVRSNQSALVPILQSSFDGRRVAIYNREVRAQNPMSAVRLHNDTGLTLEGGPVTVLDGTSYAGEAMLETIKPDQIQLLPFAVDLGCRVQIDEKREPGEVHTVAIASGRFVLRSHRIAITTYTIANEGERDLELWLDHAFRPDWALVDTPEPEERTERFVRFKLAVPARKTVNFVVKERGEQVEVQGIEGADPKSLRVWLRSRRTPVSELQRFEPVLAIADEMAAVMSEGARLQEERAAIVEGQERLRENLEVLGESAREKALRDRYVDELTKGEDQLVVLAERLEQGRAAAAALREKLLAAIAAAEV